MGLLTQIVKLIVLKNDAELFTDSCLLSERLQHKPSFLHPPRHGFAGHQEAQTPQRFRYHSGAPARQAIQATETCFPVARKCPTFSLATLTCETQQLIRWIG